MLERMKDMKNKYAGKSTYFLYEEVKSFRLSPVADDSGAASSSLGKLRYFPLSLLGFPS